MPPDDQTRPWLPSTASECPVELDKQRWIESSLRWFTEEFGTAVLIRDTVPPDSGFLSWNTYSGSKAQINELVTRCCELMMVDPASISLELFDGSASRKEAAKTGKSTAVGHFLMRDGRAVIALDRSESSDPRVLTAIAAHELCHVRLLGEGRIGRDRPDGERLTDLLSVYFGFGVFSTNAAMRFARAERGWTVVSRGQLDDRTLNAARNEGYHRLGYLSSTEWGYALACYSWLRGEKEPGWARHLDPGPRVYLEQGLAYLSRTGVDGELPTQRLLDKLVTIDGVTVRVTRGAISGPGLIQLRRDPGGS
jgi:hypothetical protein